MSAANTDINSARLAEQLAARFRVNLVGELVHRNGKTYPSIRASDIKPPNGFAIHIIPSWRSVEAAFLPDNFAGELIWGMGQSGPSARAEFGRTAQAFSEMGSRITLRINDALVGNLPHLPDAPWKKFELKVLRMTDAITAGDEALHQDLCEVASTCLALVLSLLQLEEDETGTSPFFESGLPEGAKMRVEVNRYERSPINRAACIAKYGAICNACGFDFGKIYGILGEGYIEVHHLVPVSKMGDSYLVDPIRELIPLCANCHSMVHRQDPPLALDHLKKILLDSTHS